MRPSFPVLLIGSLAWLCGCGPEATDLSMPTSGQPSLGSNHRVGAPDAGSTGSGSPNSQGEPNPRKEPVQENAAQIGWRALFRAETAYTAPTDIGTLVIDYALLAKKVSGSNQLPLAGTLTETSANQFSYSPTPSDRLVVTRLNGGWMSVRFSKLTGALASSSTFFAGNHDLLVHVVGQGVDFWVNSTRSEDWYSSQMDGLAPIYDVVCKARVTTTGYQSTLKGADYSYIETYDSSSTKGSLVCDDGEIVIDEAHTFESYISSGSRSRQRVRESNSQWSHGNRTWMLQNGKIGSSHKDGLLVEYRAQGMIYRDGTPVGRLFTEEQKLANGSINTNWLEVEGERVELGTATVYSSR